jgi:hypothetical protein
VAVTNTAESTGTPMTAGTARRRWRKKFTGQG